MQISFLLVAFISFLTDKARIYKSEILIKIPGDMKILGN